MREDWRMQQNNIMSMDINRFNDLQRRLPQRPDILGREEYYSSAVLVPLVTIGGSEQLLFEKRAAHIKQGSEICFPGGHYDDEADTSYIDTALRETEEELGISREAVHLIGQLDTLVSPRGLIVECYLASVDINAIDELVLDRNEVDEVFCVPVEWFRENPPEEYRTRVEIQSSYVDSGGSKQVLLPVDELGLPSRYKKNRSEWMHRVVVYRRNPDIIWGLTAAIVENLVNKIFAGQGKAEL